MRTMTITRLFILAMVLMMLPAVPAMAEDCALCGKETGNDAYLCAQCLLDMMEEKDLSGGMEITGAVTNDNGTVTLTWTDSGENGPYSVYYALLEQAPVPFGWTAASAQQGKSITLTQLVPGVSYVFTVENAQGNRVQHVYYAPKVVNGNEIGAKIGFKTLRHLEFRNEWQWSAAEIEADNGFEHGLYMRLHYSMLKRTRNYAFCVAVEAPGGFSDVVYSGTLTLNYGKSIVPAWGFIRMDDYFSCLERYYGGVPAGEYKVTMYFDGKYVHSDFFTVVE